ncbi:glycosyltransferase family 2 protein (plasmid) [Aliiroseovarius sp. M344]|uniref:glycosyltransferase family 2 protein n=1 Tax=Aliiroseovarius sp. M344 TaxID=2867010 RepID=UPI0021AE04FC|nr:glycosyltransferase family 2 protein [Aliiroseovarius sp. M344]UWQ16060.1 glycosyltransferase family 2 protein [Aliiroseovarius sp. M344]
MKSLHNPAQDVPAVSIVIVNWNTRDILHDCLASIAAQTTLLHEVIVVDNASSDGSADMVRAQHPDVTLIANKTNKGFAAANNQGLVIARGEKLLLLNPDTIVLDHAIDTMCAWLEDHPDVGCVGCQVYQDEETIQRTSFAEPSPINLAIVEFGLQKWAPRVKRFAVPEYRLWDRRSERDVDVVSGMFMLVPRPVFEKVGLLDEAYFVYSEEADWCRRIRDAGWRCVFAPVARILHLDGGSKSTSQIKSRMFVQMQKSKMIYVQKHHGKLGVLVTRCIFVTSAALRGTVFGLLGVLGRNTEYQARVRLAGASIRYHLTGTEPA